MGVVNDRGRFYWVKRVPKRFAGMVLGADGKPVTQVRQALHTDNKTEAQLKAAQVEAARLAEWEALAAGYNEDARAHYEAAKKLAQARGFPYQPISRLSTGEAGPLVERITSVSGENLASKSIAQAVLGTIPEVYPSLSEMKDEYFTLTRTRHLKKTAAQLKRWRQPRDRAVKNFLAVVAQRDGRNTPIAPPINEITREQALEFRDWWTDRVEGGLKPESANKDFGHLSEMWNTWSDLKKVELPNPFSKLWFEVKGRKKTKTPPFSREWLKKKILAEGAFDGLNDEARDVFLVTVNTGLRPSEVTDAPLEDYVITHNIPHIKVRENGREIKVAHTERDIPLTGVSLEAARRIVERGGIQRYQHKANSWSAVINKFLENNGMKETPDHTAYSIRHYVEDELLAAEVDDRIRADILGHEYDRPNYGTGGALEGRLKALERIAL